LSLRALVTGGAGFIGSNLVDALLARGDDVAVVDDLSTGRRSNLDGALERGAALHHADVREAAAVREIVASERPAAIFHLAAHIDVRRSVADPAFDARVNVEGTINLLEAARDAGVERFVFASTGGAIYGESAVVPTAETEPPSPLSPYGQSKYAAEGYCRLAALLHGLSTISLRYANVYGPRQDPLGEGGVIAIFCGRLREGGRPTIFGDGTQTRDYIYVADVVDATLTAAGSAATGSFNVGTGRETSVLELVEGLRQLAGSHDFAPEHEPPRLGEVHRSCLDPQLAGATLGWSPSTSLEEGLRLTLAALDPER
jgi:UDP-glucose 4-epimerase